MNVQEVLVPGTWYCIVLFRLHHNMILDYSSGTPGSMVPGTISTVMLNGVQRKLKFHGCFKSNESI